MAWQRKIPFGYQVQNGRINCHPEEAELVRAIFSRYLLGGSYSQIADEMAPARCALSSTYCPVEQTHGQADFGE